MREKAALRLSGAPEATAFAELAEKSALIFPILCSIRVTMRKSNWTGEDYMDTCIVEAVGKDMLCPRSLPISSLNYLAELLNMAAPDPTRMIAVPMCLMQRVSDIGMVVESVPLSCVISLTAHDGRQIRDMKRRWRTQAQQQRLLERTFRDAVR